MARPKDPNSIRSQRAAAREQKLAEQARAEELAAANRAAESAAAEKAKLEAEAAELRAQLEAARAAKTAENVTPNATVSNAQTDENRIENNGYTAVNQSDVSGHAGEIRNDSETVNETISPTASDDLLERLRGVSYVEKQPTETPIVDATAAQNSDDFEPETEEQAYEREAAEAEREQQRSKGNPFSRAEATPEGDIKFKFEGEKLAEWILKALDGFQKATFPKIYLQTNFTPEERILINRLKGKKAVKKGELDDFSPEEIDLLSKWYEFENYERDVAFTAEDREILYEPLSATLRESNVVLSPAWALVTAALIVMAPRILPLVTPLLLKWMDTFGKPDQQAAPAHAAAEEPSVVEVTAQEVA